MFFFNIPAGLIAIAASWYVLEQAREGAADRAGSRPALDWLGATLSGMTLLTFLLVVGNCDRQGWVPPLILSGAATTVLLVAAFVRWELYTASPMLDLYLFRNKLFTVGISASWLSFLGQSPTRFMMPFYLQRVLEFSPRDVGPLLIAPAIWMVVSGRLSDRFGWRTPTVGGLGLSAMAMAATLTATSPVILIVEMLMLQSAGMALFNSPNSSSILGAVERSQYGVVSALTQLVRNSATVTSIAIATTVVVTTMGFRGIEPSLDPASPDVADAFVGGLKWAFLVMGAVLLVGMSVSIARGDRTRSGTVPTAAD